MKSVLVLALVGLSAFSSADFYTYTFASDVSSFGGIDDPLNETRSFSLPAGALVTGVSYEVTLEAFSTSLLSEMNMGIVPLGLSLRPGGGDNFGGLKSYSSGGIFDFTDEGFADVLLPTGQVDLLFFESSVDEPGRADGRWVAGSTLTLHYTSAVPEPASLSALAVGAFALLKRRKKN